MIREWYLHFEDDATLAEGAEDGGTLLSPETTLTPSNRPGARNENSIPEIHRLLDAEVRAPGFAGAPIRGDPGLPAINALLGPARIGTNGDVRVQVRRDGLPITTPERGAAGTDVLQVLLWLEIRAHLAHFISRR